MVLVTNNNDSGAGSLRQAIADAAVGEEIQFNFSGTITLTSAELLINQDVVITGPGSGAMTISTPGTLRIFNVNTGVVVISGLTLGGGAAAQGAGIHNEATLTLSDVVVGFCASSNDGGGIWNSSTITMTDCEVVSCAASAGNGGGIYNSGTIEAFNLDVGNCTCSADGAGIWNSGTFTHDGGEVLQNTAANFGGGVYNEGTYSPTELTFGANTSAGNGAGIHNNFGTATVVRCAVTNNNPIGIGNLFGTVNVDNSTISNNTTTGIYNALGAADVKHSTIVQNAYGISQDSGSVITLQNTILAGNSTNDYDGETADAISNGNNLLGNNSNPITPAAGDQTVLTYAALLLGDLSDNGGPTFTHALLTGSPALDAGNSADAPANDQRGAGFERVINGVIDIGAYESNADEPDPDPDPEPEPEPIPPTPAGPGATGSSSDCRRVSCCDPATGVEFSPFVFSLVNGGSYTNAESTFVIPCPAGYDCTADTVTIVLPPGTVKFNPTVFNPNPPPSGSGNPWDPESGTYTFTCGSQELNVTTDGTGFTQVQLDAIINFLAECQATQDGNAILNPVPVVTPSGAPGLRLWNTEQTCTVECPEGETGDPVTVTIPAHTNSSIVAQSASPLDKYLAQQALNTAAYNQACVQAEAELDCQAPAVCPELKSTITVGINGLVAATYGLTQNYVYALMGDGSSATVRAYDIADAQVLSADQGVAAAQGLVYSQLTNRLYACVGSSPCNVNMLDATDLSLMGQLDVTAYGNNGALRYINDLDKVLLHGSGGIALIDPATNTVDADDTTGDFDNIPADYCPTNTTFYCPDNGSARIIIRNSSLAQTGSIVLADAFNPVCCVYLPSTDIVLAAAQNSLGVLVLYLIDPATNTVTSTVSDGLFGLPFAMEYDASLDLVYIVAASDDRVVTFNPADNTIICSLAVATPTSSCRQIAVNTTTDRFYVPTLQQSLIKYGQP